MLSPFFPMPIPILKRTYPLKYAFQNSLVRSILIATGQNSFSKLNRRLNRYYAAARKVVNGSKVLCQNLVVCKSWAVAAGLLAKRRSADRVARNTT